MAEQKTGEFLLSDVHNDQTTGTADAAHHMIATWRTILYTITTNPTAVLHGIVTGWTSSAATVEAWIAGHGVLPCVFRRRPALRADVS